MVRKSSAPEIIQNCTLSSRIHPGSLTARFSTQNLQFLDHLFIHSHIGSIVSEFCCPAAGRNSGPGSTRCALNSMNWHLNFVRLGEIWGSKSRYVPGGDRNPGEDNRVYFETLQISKVSEPGLQIQPTRSRYTFGNCI